MYKKINEVYHEENLVGDVPGSEVEDQNAEDAGLGPVGVGPDQEEEDGKAQDAD